MFINGNVEKMEERFRFERMEQIIVGIRFIVKKSIYTDLQTGELIVGERVINALDERKGAKVPILPIEVLSEEVLFKSDRWTIVRQHCKRGSREVTIERALHPPSVAILVTRKEKDGSYSFLTITQFRLERNRSVEKLPGGSIDNVDRDFSKENMLQVGLNAIRELKEETGINASNIIYLNKTLHRDRFKDCASYYFMVEIDDSEGLGEIIPNNAERIAGTRWNSIDGVIENGFIDGSTFNNDVGLIEALKLVRAKLIES